MSLGEVIRPTCALGWGRRGGGGGEGGEGRGEKTREVDAKRRTRERRSGREGKLKFVVEERAAPTGRLSEFGAKLAAAEFLPPFRASSPLAPLFLDKLKR